MAIPKKELMARLEKERREQGLIKKSYWIYAEEHEKVKKFIENMRKGLNQTGAK